MENEKEELLNRLIKFFHKSIQNKVIQNSYHYTYACVGQAKPAGQFVQLTWFCKPFVVCPIRHLTGGCDLLGHIYPAEQLLQVASPFREYVPVGQAPAAWFGSGQEKPDGHGVQNSTP